MKDTAISIQNISKEFQISSQGKKETFKALDNINLNVQRGKVFGLIGPNGAGKSTLLKILARITYPTQGRVEINGRLASLLEVGTGFHPELTGRENIFLNGAILGMHKQEIKQQFEEIVEFSGVAKFLDTPVKHYSSGMYVRLAFSVAAHLNAEVLLIDEVLAVGDAEFQRKCINKMNDASSSQNRTVIFVSHNMSIARNLCDEIAYLEHGVIQRIGSAEEVTDFYLESLYKSSEETLLADRKDRRGSKEAFIKDIRIYDPASGRKDVLISGEEVAIEIDYVSEKFETLGELYLLLNIFNSEGNFLTTLSNQLTGALLNNIKGSGTITCRIPKLPFMAGSYFINSNLFVNGLAADHVKRAVNFTVLEGDYFKTGHIFKMQRPGIFIDQEWKNQTG